MSFNIRLTICCTCTAKCKITQLLTQTRRHIQIHGHSCVYYAVKWIKGLKLVTSSSQRSAGLI